MPTLNKSDCFTNPKHTPHPVVMAKMQEQFDKHMADFTERNKGAKITGRDLQNEGKDAAILVVENHLRMLERDRVVMVADINRQLVERGVVGEKAVAPVIPAQEPVQPEAGPLPAPVEAKPEAPAKDNAELRALIKRLIPNYNMWGFAGPSNAKARQEIMAYLLGRKVSQADSGMGKVEKAVFEAAGVRDDREFREWLKGEDNNKYSAAPSTDIDAARKGLENKENSDTMSGRSHIYGYNNDFSTFNERLQIPDNVRDTEGRLDGNALLVKQGVPITQAEADWLREEGYGNLIGAAPTGGDVAPVELVYPFRLNDGVFDRTAARDTLDYNDYPQGGYGPKISSNDANYIRRKILSSKNYRAGNAYKQATDSPYYSQSQSPAANAHTEQSLISAFKGFLNWDALDGTGFFHVVGTAAALPDGVSKTGTRGVVTRGGHVYFVADQISKGQEQGVALHEIGVHYGMEEMVGTDKFAAILKQMEAMNGKSAAITEAFKLVPADTLAENRTEEALGYLTEIAPQHSIVRRIVAAVRAWLFKKGWLVKAENLTDADIVAIARAAMKGVEREASEGGINIKAQQYVDLMTMQPISISAANKTVTDFRTDYKHLEPAITRDHKTVNFVNSIIGKIEGHKNHAQLFRIVPQFKELLEGAIPAYFETERDVAKHINIKGFDNYVTKVSMDGGEYFVRFSVQLLKGRHGVDGRSELHNAAVSDVEIYKAGPQSLLSGLSTPTNSTISTSPIDYRLAQWLDEIKQAYDSASEDRYSLRTKPAPGKTIKAYKLFTVKKSAPGQIFPLFVDANTPVDFGVWHDADVGELTKEGKVKSKLGPLAFRPGWHMGDLPLATHIGEGGQPPTHRPATQVWAEVEVAADQDWQEEANRRGVNKAGKIIPVKAHITDQIPEDGYYRYKTNPNMTGNWIISGAIKVNRILSDEEVAKINAASDTADLPRRKPLDLAEHGFNGDGTPAVNLYSAVSPELIQAAKNTLTRYGTPSSLVKQLDDAFPAVTRAFGYLFNNPVFQGERDAKLRKPGEVSIKDFVDTGINRSENNMEFQLEMMGWDGKNSTAPTFGQRAWTGLTQWESSDTTTEWGRIEREVRKGLDAKQQAALDIMQAEGDVNNVVYGTIDAAMKNKRIAAAAPTEAAFKAYKRVRDFIDGPMVEARISLISKLGEATGADKALVAGTISAYRARLATLQGWMPRKHGEGTHQVNIYHTVKDLPFQDAAIEEGHVATLKFYAGNDVAKEIRTFARENMLSVTKNNIGAPIVIAHDGTKDKVKANIAKLEKKIAATKVIENKEALQAKLATLQEKLAIVDRPSDERISDFMDASKGFLANVRQKYEENMQALRDELAEDGSDHRRIKADMAALGDGTVKVKAYMRLHETKRQADKHKAEVDADIKGKLDHVYHEGEEYTTSYKMIDPVSEGLYGDMAGDFAAENIIKKAIEKAQQTGRIDNSDASGVKSALFRNYADVMLARGAGRNQIRRAPYLIQGYDKTDSTQLYHDYMTSTAGMLSKAVYAKKQFDNYRYAPADIKPWAETYIKNTLRNMGHADSIGGNVRAIATFMYLGFKMSSILVNGTQTWTLGVAELGRRTQQNSIKAVGKAQFDILKNRLSKDEQDIFNNQLWKEQEMATAIHEMSGQGEKATSKASKFMHTLVGKSLLPFQEMEMLNRRTMVLASYRSFLADGMSKSEALEQALDVNKKSNFDPSRANLPEWAHKPAGRTIYALQMFTLNNWNWIYNRATSGEKADILALLKYAGMLSALGGVSALAGGDEVNKLLRWLTGKDYKLAMQVWTRRHAKEFGTPGELLNAAVWHGGMGALGVNISNAMRLNVPMSGFITGDTTAGEAAMGIWSGLWNKGQNVARYAGRGDVYKAIESASPAFIESPMKAARMMSEGSTTSHGKPVLDEHGKVLRYSGLDAAKRAVGLQPLEQSFRQEATQSQRKLQTYWSEKRGTLLDRVRIARTVEDRKDVMKEVMQYNRDVRKSQAWPVVGIITATTLSHSRAASKPDKKKQSWFKNVVG